MKQPLVTVEDVNSRLDFVEAFVNNPNLRMQVRDLLRGEKTETKSRSSIIQEKILGDWTWLF